MQIIETNLNFKAMSNRQTTERIILHHSASSTATAEQIHSWHLGNGWEGAGYHFLVRKDGKVYRMRPEEKIGAHAYMNNYNSLGICFEGNFEVEQMPDIQVQSGKELVAYLKNKYGINKVQGHRDVNTALFQQNLVTGQKSGGVDRLQSFPRRFGRQTIVLVATKAGIDVIAHNSPSFRLDYFY